MGSAEAVAGLHAELGCSLLPACYAWRLVVRVMRVAFVKSFGVFPQPMLRLEQVEGDLDLAEDWDGGSVFCAGREFPLRNGGDGLLVEAHA